MDLIVVGIYFVLVMVIALRGRQDKDATIDDYFLGSRKLKWYSIAFSTIATNVHGYQFLGMMGSAYLFGLAQANFEINAIQGLWMAAFIFVPLYLKDRVVTISQFIKNRLGKTVSLTYSIANIIMFAFLGIGIALMWGAYVAELVFQDELLFISENRLTRLIVLIIFLGVFSAIYTYFGGLAAVVRTDILQFGILTLGGILILWVSIKKLGGFEQLYEKTPELMHLHLPIDHPQLPWLGMLGLFFLNINYWCANQSVIQRSLAARTLKDAQTGLMVGGVMKYLMALIVIIPGIALAGILGPEALVDEPDKAFSYIVTNFLPTGLRGIMLCAIFASLMSTIDSVFNSLATLFSIDIYKGILRKEATDQQVVATGRKTILVGLITGIITAIFLISYKIANAESAFTHALNDLRYIFNTGFVVIICVAVFLVFPKNKLALLGFIATLPINLLTRWLYPDMNYLIRALVIISVALLIVAIPTIIQNGNKPVKEYVQFGNKGVKWFGFGLLISLLLCHMIWH
ncbi:sodium:solute symporter family transporter [Croceitalea sp. P059]|uniref:SLC5 family protein n=1 Tax=Croceitalea sp. P059 TaxID=3075601 RepID=UPI0028854303|nr:sodium/solute symporter [Croceitalea sp. P059]MDT0539819.1 sodium/solute symporter [Croceitalea sp. P059]